MTMATPGRTSAVPSTSSSPSRPPLSSSARSLSSTSVPTSTGHGLARTPSLRQSRLGRKATARMSTSIGPAVDQEEDERSTMVNLIADLKEQVQRAEQASEQYRKHIEVMQQRLDESANDQTLAEERDFQRQTQLDRLQAEIKEAARQRRELELAHESETRMLLQERERQTSRETHLQSVIIRLNESLRKKELTKLSADGQTENAETSQSGSANSDKAVTTQEGHESALMDSHIQTIQEKDWTIEQLRLELADLHLKVAEQEHLGDSHLQVLEQRVTDLRVQNARLQEENESFQMLLSEKTLKGDFMAESRSMNTLAEELETESVATTLIADSDLQTDTSATTASAYQKLEAELKATKEENKGLTLYIDKIIGRLLQHDGFEHIVDVAEDKEDQLPPPAPPKNAAQANHVEKALPATPGEDSSAPAATSTVTNAAQSFLKRAGSLMSRPGNARPARPTSMALGQPSTPSTPSTANENPDTAPSIPLNRAHRRSRSDMPPDQPQQDLGAAVVVQQMNRGSPLRSVSSGTGTMSHTMRPMSPPMQQQRTASAGTTGYFSASHSRSPPRTSRVASRPGSSQNSIMSDHSQDRGSGSNEGRSTGSSMTQHSSIPGAVMKQNQLRPLRLVQELTKEEEEAQKRLNRNSWIGWLKGGPVDTQA